MHEDGLVGGVSKGNIGMPITTFKGICDRITLVMIHGKSQFFGGARRFMEPEAEAYGIRNLLPAFLKNCAASTAPGKQWARKKP